MAARLRQRASAENQSWPCEQAFLHRHGQAKIRARGIPDGGKAALQHPAQDHGRPGCEVHRRPFALAGQVCRSSRHVHVAIDETWHQRPAAEIDGAVLLGRPDLCGVAHLDDSLVFDQHRLIGKQLAALRVQHRRVRKPCPGQVAKLTFAREIVTSA